MGRGRSSDDHLRGTIIESPTHVDDVPIALLEQARERSGFSDGQIIRRLDWRFLLPNPTLGNVAYIGPMTGTLPVALRRFSELLTVVLPTDELRADLRLYELVVLQSRAVEAVENAKPLMASGGYLYWEVERISGVGHVRDYVKAVERLGFGDIQVSWHRPDFESCLEMIPLTDPVALRFAFSRHHEGVGKRLKFAAGRLLMTTGLLARAVPCFSIVARDCSGFPTQFGRE